jgi:hypothetical protein
VRRDSRRVRRLLAGAALLLACTGVHGAPLFEDDAVLEARISGPFGVLLEDLESSDYRRFTITVDGVEVPLKIRLRGHSRRRVCEFPPLMLNFRPDTSPDSVFAGQDKIKLVTHCRNNGRGEQDLLEEYLAYRVLNQLTAFSFRVRPLRVEYVDGAGDLPEGASPRYAFVIESREEFAARTGAERASLPAFPRHAHDRAHAALIYVFQYLVGNTDWQLLRAEHDDDCCHNLELFTLDGALRFVPYDFDLTGLVDARYAYPDPQLRIKRVRQRLYRGLCTDRSVLAAALERVRAARGAILAEADRVPGLSEKNARSARTYLADFFDDAETPEDLLETFERRCIDSY